jgi:hypothetical protein
MKLVSSPFRINTAPAQKASAGAARLNMGSSPDREAVQVIGATPHRLEMWSGPSALEEGREMSSRTFAARWRVPWAVDTVRADVLAEAPSYFSPEKGVGVRIWLLMLATMGPSRSLSSRTLWQAGVILECRPTRLAICQRLPREYVGQLVAGFPDESSRNRWDGCRAFPRWEEAGH